MTLERPASGLRLGHETRIEGDETFEAFDAARPGTCVTDPMTKPQRRPLSRVETAAERPSYYVSLLNLSLEDDRVRDEIGVRRAKAQRPLTSVHISRGVKAALSQELRRTADQGRVTSPVLAPSPRTLPVSSSRPASPDVSAVLRDESVGSPSRGPAAEAPADPATVDTAPLGDVYGPEYARDLLARSERTGASAFLSDALTQSQRRQRPVAPVSIDALLTHTHRQAEATPKHKARPAAVPVDLRRAGSAASRLLFSYPGDGDLGLKQRAAARAAFAAEVSREMEFEPSLAHRRRDEHAALERRRRRPQHTSFSFLQGGPDVPSFVSPTPTPQPRPFSPSIGPGEPSPSSEPVSALCQVAHHVGQRVHGGRHAVASELLDMARAGHREAREFWAHNPPPPKGLRAIQLMQKARRMGHPDNDRARKYLDV